MMTKDINSTIPAEIKQKVKDLLSKFNIPGLTTPAVAQAAPAITPQVQPVVLQEATLQDGTVIKYDTPTLAVGSVVTVVSPEGEMPAPVGELQLQDGTVIKVGEGGKVETVTPGAPAAPQAPVQQVDQTPIINAMKSEYEVKFKAFAAEKEVFTKQFEAQKTELVNLRKDVGEFIKMFSDILELPTAKPVETPKNKQTKIERFINR